MRRIWLRMGCWITADSGTPLVRVWDADMNYLGTYREVFGG